ncbi:RNA-directed DNA polymerase from mobile element jockey [Caerostris extrusa]|uniref:RNA-directed DNA polymerase from mobile element jockey n=1 Tax=Caerostris extrusa TaxID=172846 RepID=A0AAV4TS21_CAEEX|nr:RNA-directed DNA polymerase from mobile element jockey [Caerostris extrusa]
MGMIMDDHTYTREKEDAMEVTAEGSLALFRTSYRRSLPRAVADLFNHPLRCGTAILIKNNISHHEVPTPSLNSIKTTIISVHFANIPPPPPSLLLFMLPAASDLLTDLTTLLSINNSSILSGDFNSPHIRWGSHTNSYTVINLLNFSVRTGFEIIAPSTPTRYGLNSSSVIDPTILNNFHCTYDITSISELSSYHNPVLLNFNVNYITLNIPLKFPPTGKPLPNSFLQITPLFPSNIDNSNDLETAVDNLTTNHRLQSCF